MRRVVECLSDEGSVLELRRQFAPGLVTALIRIEGKAFGLMANNPRVLGGAIDADAGDKASRFMQLCNAFSLPIISLCDTPGFTAGPVAEKTGTVRHVSRMFVNAANLTVPVFTVVVRKGYGLGARPWLLAASMHLFSRLRGQAGSLGPSVSKALCNWDTRSNSRRSVIQFSARPYLTNWWRRLMSRVRD